MLTRILPVDEWPRLSGTELETAWPHLRPEDTSIIVVEHENQIVGCWAVVRYVHVEGVWVHPDHRRRGGVARRLLAAMWRTARGLGAGAVLTGAMSDDVRGILDGLGASRLPGDHYVVPIRG